MKRVLPQTLAGQMISLLLIALVTSQALSFWFFFDERRLAVRAAARSQVFARTASIIRLLGETPPRLHGQILDTASSPRLLFWLSDTAAAQNNDDHDTDDRSAFLAERLQSNLDSVNTTVIVEIEDDDGRFFTGQPKRRLRHERSESEFRGHWPRDHTHGRRERSEGQRRPQRVGLTLSVALPDSTWLNARTAFFTPPLTWAVPSIAAMAVMAFALIVIVIVMVRRLTGPMRRLAVAADRLGRGEAVEPLKEEGPSDVRRTTQAFDKMRERLQRFVQDRTRMLAAISHDLRTPLTALRLRAEFIPDQDIKEKMLETIDEMNAMVEATLAFAREEGAQEDTRVVDLTALLDSVCADFSDLGDDVTFASGGRVTYSCRPIGLKRALRNLVENSVRYGGNARVSLDQTDTDFQIRVEDDGPGIPETDLERVFEPFMRLDPSRNQESGGIGLGLSIVRSIIRSHGGDVILKNRAEGGLCVLVKLPKN